MLTANTLLNRLKKIERTMIDVHEFPYSSFMYHPDSETNPLYETIKDFFAQDKLFLNSDPDMDALVDYCLSMNIDIDMSYLSDQQLVDWIEAKTGIIQATISQVTDVPDILTDLGNQLYRTDIGSAHCTQSISHRILSNPKLLKKIDPKAIAVWILAAYGMVDDSHETKNYPIVKPVVLLNYYKACAQMTDQNEGLNALYGIENALTLYFEKTLAEHVDSYNDLDQFLCSGLLTEFKTLMNSAAKVNDNKILYNIPECNSIFILLNMESIEKLQTNHGINWIDTNGDYKSVSICWHFRNSWKLPAGNSSVGEILTRIKSAYSEEFENIEALLAIMKEMTDDESFSYIHDDLTNRYLIGGIKQALTEMSSDLNITSLINAVHIMPDELKSETLIHILDHENFFYVNNNEKLLNSTDIQALDWKVPFKSIIENHDDFDLINEELEGLSLNDCVLQAIEKHDNPDNTIAFRQTYTDIYRDIILKDGRKSRNKFDQSGYTI